MKLPKYQLKSGRELLSYEFTSVGPKGLIEKQIQFTLLNQEDVYNLAFGDKDPITGEIDDLVVSNNGDSEKVLSTVVSAVYAFFDKYPDASIFATGSTPARTRLYQVGIAKYFDDISADFVIYGQLEDHWELFNKGKNYLAFLAQRKLF